MRDKELIKTTLQEVHSEWKEGGARMAREFSELLETHEKSFRKKFERYVHAAIEEGAYVSDIARWIGVSRGTVYRILRDVNSNGNTNNKEESE